MKRSQMLLMLSFLACTFSACNLLDTPGDDPRLTTAQTVVDALEKPLTQAANGLITTNALVAAICINQDLQQVASVQALCAQTEMSGKQIAAGLNKVIDFYKLMNDLLKAQMQQPTQVSDKDTD